MNDWLYISGNPVDSDLETGSLTSFAFLEAKKSISVAPKRAPSCERVILDELSVLIRERVISSSRFPVDSDPGAGSSTSVAFLEPEKMIFAGRTRVDRANRASPEAYVLEGPANNSGMAIVISASQPPSHGP